MRRRLTVMTAIVVGLLMVTSPAFAHYVYNDDTVAEFGGNKCLEVRAEISHGRDNGGYSASDVHSWLATPFPVPGMGCEASVEIGWNRPARKLQAKVQLWKRYSAGWGLCQITSWKSVGGDAWRVTKHHNWSRPCGHGYYSTRAFGKVFYNSHWHRGRLWSGSHYL